MKNETEADEAVLRFGRNVRALRDDRGWSQERLAELIGEHTGKPMKGVTVLRMEKGTRPTTVTDLIVAARIFNVPIADLIAMEPDQLLGTEGLKADLKRMERELVELQRAVGQFDHERSMFNVEWSPEIMANSHEEFEARRAEGEERKARLTEDERKRGELMTRIRADIIDPETRRGVALDFGAFAEVASETGVQEGDRGVDPEAS